MNPSLQVDGMVERPGALSFEELRRFAEHEQERDVSRFHANRHGDAVTLESILARVKPLPDANYLTLHADKDDFHVSVPLEPLRGQGLVVYARGGGPLGAENHGPFRFLIKDPTACQTSELDDCANVKYLSRIELTARKGRDTRPTTEAEHAAIHAAEGHQP